LLLAPYDLNLSSYCSGLLAEAGAANVIVVGLTELIEPELTNELLVKAYKEAIKVPPLFCEKPVISKLNPLGQRVGVNEKLVATASISEVVDLLKATVI
jgi:hypothetical protein